MTDTTGYVYLCMTLHGWGSGPTEKEALRLCRDHNGRSHVEKYGYVMYKVHNDFEVDQIDGTVRTPIGHPAIKVADKRKRK